MSRAESPDIADIRLDADRGPPMILVMGVTGSGKSYFINRLAGRTVVPEGASLNSCTQQCTPIPVSVGGTKALIIDTPGFDDSNRKDSEILTEIAKLLAGQHALGVQLKGIIYIHRITDNRYAGSAIKTFEVFKRICGINAMRNVVLVTSRWGDVDESTGAARERELREQFWAYMLGHGSSLCRYHGDSGSARAITAQILVKENVLLQLQDEMANEGKNLDETAAGSYVSDGLSEQRAKFEKELRDLETLRSQLREDDRIMGRQIQADMRLRSGNLKDAEKQQVSLKRDIVEEVEQQIKRETKRSRLTTGFKKVLPYVPFAINLLLVILGGPPIGDVVSHLAAFFDDDPN